MENYWQQYVQHQTSANLDNDNFHTVFGSYILLIPARTDIYIMGGYQGVTGVELARALKQVLQTNVVYISVCQNDDGFPGNNRLFQKIQKE
jgi:NADH dehydrogenase FAD-containing subunit